MSEEEYVVFHNDKNTCLTEQNYGLWDIVYRSVWYCEVLSSAVVSLVLIRQ